jgi:Tfp pilus assembly protein PilX
MNRRQSIRSRGSVGLAILVVLVILQLLLVGMILGGAREQDLSVQRIDTCRAFYAAEAGANMALREEMRGEDCDGDGGIGTISNDGLTANDPTVGIAQVCVTSGVSGMTTTLTSRGRCAATRRRIDVAME